MDLQTILWAALKLAAALAVVYLWIRLIQRHVVPYFHAAESGAGGPASSAGGTKRFPFLKVGGLVVLSCATLWLAQAELAYRKVSGTPDRTIDRDRAEKLRADGAKEPAAVPSDGKESLADRTERMLDEAKEQNAKAKEDFLKNNKPPQ